MSTQESQNTGHVDFVEGSQRDIETDEKPTGSSHHHHHHHSGNGSHHHHHHRHHRHRKPMKMRTKILIGIVIFVTIVILAGCYIILKDIHEVEQQGNFTPTEYVSASHGPAALQ